MAKPLNVDFVKKKFYTDEERTTIRENEINDALNKGFIRHATGRQKFFRAIRVSPPTYVPQEGERLLGSGRNPKRIEENKTDLLFSVFGKDTLFAAHSRKGALNFITERYYIKPNETIAAYKDRLEKAKWQIYEIIPDRGTLMYDTHGAMNIYGNDSTDIHDIRFGHISKINQVAKGWRFADDEDDDDDLLYHKRLAKNYGKHLQSDPNFSNEEVTLNASDESPIFIFKRTDINDDDIKHMRRVGRNMRHRVDRWNEIKDISFFVRNNDIYDRHMDEKPLPPLPNDEEPLPPLPNREASS